LIERGSTVVTSSNVYLRSQHDTVTNRQFY